MWWYITLQKDVCTLTDLTKATLSAFWYIAMYAGGALLSSLPATLLHHLSLPSPTHFLLCVICYCK